MEAIIIPCSLNRVWIFSPDEVSLSDTLEIVNNKISKKVFFRLPDDVKSARLQGKDAFDSWKQLNFPLEGDVHETYRTTWKENRQKLRSFLDQTETDRIRKLCHAA